MLKCESCLSRFQQASDLFQHIQSSCLSFYKKHPEHWAQILSKMTLPVENEDTTPLESGNMEEVQTEEIEESAVAKKPPETNPAKKEVPFCIMFKAQKMKKGQPVLSLQMTVSEYYYGAVAGKRVESKQVSRPCKCSDCGKILRNNTRFMSHLRHKILNRREKKEGADARNICNHCFREYSSPFLLQCHLENVHGTVAASTTCKICDSHYQTDREFLGHMKDVHVQNEAPYSCKVCSYRSSFYNDVSKHFRDEHAHSTGLMCPFCLFVALSAHPFSKHVLQHAKKGFACSRCRLIFNTTTERLAHQNNDHLSQNMKEKTAKFKNSHLCQIYVKAAPYKDDTNDKTLQSDLERRLNGSSAPKVLKRPVAELPTYLCPAKRSNCVRKIGETNEASVTDTKCSECGEVLKSADIREHFRYQHECKWCVYVTSCERASHDHVLREHANAELRDQLFGKTEKEDASFPMILQDDADDDTLSKIKEEPEDILPTMPGRWEDMDTAPPALPNASETLVATKVEPGSPDRSPPTKARRKQSNPTRIPDLARPVPITKPIKRDRCVQTKGLEKEKGVQACDQDFQNLHGNVDQLDNTISLDSKGKVKRRKILAQPGYFPDIDDDEGWARYFSNAENDPVPGKPKSKVNPSNGALPTMVPRQGTFSILNKALKAHHTGSGSDNDGKEPNDSTGSEKQSISASAGSVTGKFPSQISSSLRRAPLAPNNLRCVDVTHEHMLVQWDPPSNGAVTQYKIVFQGVGPQTVQILPVQQTLVKLVGLKSNVMYSVRVYTLYFTGVSDYTNIFVKTKPGPSSARSLTSQVSSASTAATLTNSKATLPQLANTSVASSVVHYKTSVGVPISTYLALKSAAVNTAKNTARAAISNVSVYATSSVKSMPKPLTAELKNGTPIQNLAVNRLLPVAVTAPVGSQVQRSGASVATVASLKSVATTAVAKDEKVPDPNFKYSVPTASSTKEESNDVYLVLDDEEEGHTSSGGLTVGCGNVSSSKTTVQSCVTMEDGDVILVLDDNDRSLQSTANVGGKSSAVSEEQSLDIDAGVSVSSQSDIHEVHSEEATKQTPASVGVSHLSPTDSTCESNQDGEDDTSAVIKVADQDGVDEASIDIAVVSIERCDSKNAPIRGEPEKQNVIMEAEATSSTHEVDETDHGTCEKENDISSMLKNSEDITAKMDTDPEDRDACKKGNPEKENDCNSMTTNSEDMNVRMDADSEDQDVPDVLVHTSTDENSSDCRDGADDTGGEGCSATNNIDNESPSEQKDQNNFTDTDVGECSAGGNIPEGNKVRDTIKVSSTNDESPIAANDRSSNMDCDALIAGAEESVSVNVKTLANDCNSMPKNSEDMNTKMDADPEDQDVPDVFVHTSTDENFSDCRDGADNIASEQCKITNNIDKKSPSEQKDLNKITDTDLGESSADGNVPEGKKIQDTLKVSSTNDESSIAANDRSSNMDCDALIAGAEESVSVGVTNPSHVDVVECSESIKAGENVQTIPTGVETADTSRTDFDGAKEVTHTINIFGLEENVCREMENSALPGKSTDLNPIKEQLAPSAVAFVNTTQAASKNVINPAMPTVESCNPVEVAEPSPSAIENSLQNEVNMLPGVSTNLKPVEEQSSPSATPFVNKTQTTSENASNPAMLVVESLSAVGNSRQNEPNVSCTEVNASASGMLEKCSSGVDESVSTMGVTMQNPIQHVAAMPASGMALQDGELLHGDVLQNVEATANDCSQQDEEIKAIVEGMDDNLAGLSGTDLLKPGILDELLDEKDMFWL